MAVESEINVEAGPAQQHNGSQVARGRYAEGPEREMLLYAVTVLFVVGTLYFLPFFVVRTALYARWNPSLYSEALNEAFEMAGQDADVVLFGDSTATLGVDPSMLSSALGMKALNLSNTRGSLIANDDLALRRYLGTNRPPKLIVFYFAPWDFDYGHKDFDSRPIYEGEELLIQRGTGAEMLTFVRKHPEDALTFPFEFYAPARWHLAHAAVRKELKEQLQRTRGHLDSPVTTRLEDPCQFPQTLIDSIRFDWVRALGSRYKSAQTRVMFYVAAVPACSNVSEVLARPYDELPAAPPRVLPPELFNTSIRYVHPRAVAVPELTQQLALQVRGFLQGPKGVSSAAVSGQR